MEKIIKKITAIISIICILCTSIFSSNIIAYDTEGITDSSTPIATSDTEEEAPSVVLKSAQKIYNSILGRTDIVYSDKEKKDSEIIADHPEQIEKIDCSSFVSSALWAIGYEQFKEQHNILDMVNYCADGTYASYGLKIYKNENGTTKKWYKGNFVEDNTLKNGIDFLQPGDIIVVNGNNPDTGKYVSHTNIFIQKENNSAYRALDCGKESNWQESKPYIIDQNLWEINGSYVIRVGELRKKIIWSGIENTGDYRVTLKLYKKTVKDENKFLDVIIENIEDLVELSNQVANGNSYRGKAIILNNDLDFKNTNSYKNSNTTTYGDLNRDGKVQTIKEELTTGNGFIPIGIDEDLPFSGTFYGQGHEIRNLYFSNINDENENKYTGLFGYIINSKIYDLGVTGVINNQKEELGGIVGKAEYSEINNCYNKINMKENLMYAGGIAGIIRNSKILNCYNSGDIIGDSYFAGGIVRVAGENSTISNCYNTGRICINNPTSHGCWFGGIAGSAGSDVMIVNCYNEGEIIANSNGLTNYVGGILGYSSRGTTINKCYNTGHIKGICTYDTRLELSGGHWDMVGGIVGNAEYMVKNCYNTGNIEADDVLESSVGGIAGRIEDSGRIYNCYNIGNVTINEKAKGSYTGGIGGYMFRGDVYACYNAGTIKGKNLPSLSDKGYGYVSQIVARVEGSGRCSYIYYINQQIEDEVLTKEKMRTEYFVDILNNARKNIVDRWYDISDLAPWIYKENQYPTFDITVTGKEEPRIIYEVTEASNAKYIVSTLDTKQEKRGDGASVAFKWNSELIFYNIDTDLLEEYEIKIIKVEKYYSSAKEWQELSQGEYTVTEEDDKIILSDTVQKIRLTIDGVEYQCDKLTKTAEVIGVKPSEMKFEQNTIVIPKNISVDGDDLEVKRICENAFSNIR